jgi:hypothetical protein
MQRRFAEQRQMRQHLGTIEDEVLMQGAILLRLEQRMPLGRWAVGLRGLRL